MRIRTLITGGSTCSRIDNVRRISNIFTGKSGTKIAKYFLEQGAVVTLLNSRPLIEYAEESIRSLEWDYIDINVIQYRTFDELKDSIQRELADQPVMTGETPFQYDVIIHSAAVSDYGVDGAYEMGYDDTGNPMMWPINEPKIKSGRKELYLKLVPLPKIVDLIKTEWGFKGILVKFKLESQKSDQQLIDIALKSMRQSDADFIVANCLEWYSQRAVIISKNGSIADVNRDTLNSTLYDLINQELLHRKEE